MSAKKTNLFGDRQIAVSKKPSLTEYFAAEELKKYLEKITGAHFEISTSGEIILGKAAKQKNHILASELNRLSGDSFIVDVGDTNVYLSGVNDRGTLYSVYHFLEMLGCWWFAPSFGSYEGNNEYVPKTNFIILERAKIIQQPRMKYRKKYVEEGITHNKDNLISLIDWMAKNRMNVLVCPADYQAQGKVKWDNWRETLIPELEKRSILIEVGGHGYNSFLRQEEHFDTHPEWFGMLNGERKSDQKVIFCSSNDEAVEKLFEEISRFLKSHPEIDIFDLWPPDSNKWCECRECMLLGEPEERQARILKKAVEILSSQFPDVTIEFISYASYQRLPKKVILPESLLVDFADIGRNFNTWIYDEEDERNRKYYETFLAWLESFGGEISIYSYYRKYVWRSLPIIIPHTIANEINHYQNLGSVGLGSYSEPGDWAIYELNHLVIARWSYGTRQDIDSYIERYCQVRFGSSWKEVRQYIETIEDTMPKILTRSGPNYRDIDFNDMIKNLHIAQQQIKKAEKTAKSDEKTEQLIKKLKLSIEYALMDTKVHKAYLLKKDEEKREKVTELKKWLQAHRESGVLVVSRIGYDTGRPFKTYSTQL